MLSFTLQTPRSASAARRAVSGALGLAAVALTAGAAGASTLDFEGVFTGGQQGEIAGTEFSGVTITTTAQNGLGLYDSSCRTNCTGGDEDLATGANITAPPINAGEQTPAENYILINSNGNVDGDGLGDPGFGDAVTDAIFTFSFAVPSFIESFVLIDIDENPEDVMVTFNYADGVTSPSLFGGQDATTVLNAGADNAYSVFDIAQISDVVGDPNLLLPVSSLNIAFDDISGGIASVHATPVPVPAALPLFASGLGLFGWVARRRRG